MIKAVGMTFGIVGWIAILSAVWWVIGWWGRRRAEKEIYREIVRRWG